MNFDEMFGPIMLRSDTDPGSTGTDTVPPVVDENWQFGQPPVTDPPDPLPTYVTKDDLAAFAETLVTRLAPAPRDEDDGFEQRIAAKVRAELEPVIANRQTALESRMAELSLPTVRDSLATEITKGLNPAARQDMAKYLGKYNLAGLEALSKDKDTLDILRHSAENMSSKAAASAPAPDTLGVGGPAGATDPEIEAHLDGLQASFGNVPGFDRAKMKETLLKGVR